MSTVPQHTRTGLLGGAALLLVLLGVLAMHGVGGHAAGHGTRFEAHHDDSVPTLVVERHVAGPDAVPQLTSGTQDRGWWVALCLAALAGAVLLLLGTGAGRPGRLSREWSAAAARVPGRRDRDPPSLIVLSVCRC